jgi:hypothetical protein
VLVCRVCKRGCSAATHQLVSSSDDDTECSFPEHLAFCVVLHDAVCGAWSPLNRVKLALLRSAQYCSSLYITSFARMQSAEADTVSSMVVMMQGLLMLHVVADWLPGYVNHEAYMLRHS